MREMIGDRVCPSRPLRRVTIYTMLYCTHGVCLKIRPFRFPLLMAARVRARITWMMQANPHVNEARAARCSLADGAEGALSVLTAANSIVNYDAPYTSPLMAGLGDAANYGCG